MLRLPARQQEWIKAHCVTGTLTHVVTAIIIKEPNASDSKQFPLLLETTAKSFDIGEVLADKGYSSRRNLELVDKAGATPYILFRDNAAGRGGGIWTKSFHYFQLYREEFLLHYHQRSNGESTFSMLKRKFGHSVRSRSDTAMKNEVICKVICHNIAVLIQAIFELGIDPQFWPPPVVKPAGIHRVL
jgi:hypothetical protein